MYFRQNICILSMDNCMYCAGLCDLLYSFGYDSPVSEYVVYTYSVNVRLGVKTGQIKRLCLTTFCLLTSSSCRLLETSKLENEHSM